MLKLLRGQPLIIWGGVVQNGKKIVRRVAGKKKSVQGAFEKKIMFGQFNPKSY